MFISLLSPKLTACDVSKSISWLLVSKLPPSCGEVSFTRSEPTPVKLEPSPEKDVAVQVPVIVAPPLVVSNFLTLLWYKSVDPLSLQAIAISSCAFLIRT